MEDENHFIKFPGILKKTDKRRKNAKAAVIGSYYNSENINNPLTHGCTPLMFACQQGDYKNVVDILKKDHSSVLKRDRSLRCALHYCAEPGAARVTCADRILMAEPELNNARDADGLTALHLAVIQGNVPLIQLLLASGADINAVDNELHTVVHWATVCGEVSALHAVLSAGARAATPDGHGGYPLHYAAQMCGAPATLDNQSKGAALEVLRILLYEGGAKSDVRDTDGRTPLLWAASAGSASAVLALINAGAKVDETDNDGLSALHCAASRGHTECIETLVSLCGAKIDAIDSNGCTPLHYAVTLGHADATSLLLQHGADPHRQDKKGRSPAHCGAAKGQLETVRMLGGRGADLWLRNLKGDLPLHEAAMSGRRELVKWFLDLRPSQVNASNNDGKTPLHMAAIADQSGVCRLLIDRGAVINPLARTSGGNPVTPLDCAINKGHRATAKLLQSQGGMPAARLSKNNVVIDNINITSLPRRHFTNTTIALNERIKIERCEIYESGLHTLRRSYPTDDSDTSSDRMERNCRNIKSYERRFSSNLCRSDKEDLKKDEYRSRSEPRGDRRRKMRSERKKYHSDSECSSASYHSHRISCQRRRKKTRRNSCSSISTDESDTKHRYKRNGKKESSIQSINDKKTANLYKKVDECYTKQLISNKEKIKVMDISDSKKAASETESDTPKVTTVVIEAQVHSDGEETVHNQRLDFDDKKKTEEILKQDGLNVVELKKEKDFETDCGQIQNDVVVTQDETPETVKENSKSKTFDSKIDDCSNKEVKSSHDKKEKELVNATVKLELQEKSKDSDSNLKDSSKSINATEQSLEHEIRKTSNKEIEKQIIDEVEHFSPAEEPVRKKSFEIVYSPDEMKHSTESGEKSEVNLSGASNDNLNTLSMVNGKENLSTSKSNEGLVSILKVSDTTKAVQRVLIGDVSDGIRSTFKSPELENSETRKGSIYETESYKVISDLTSASDSIRKSKHQCRSFDFNSDDDKESIMESSRFLKEHSRIPSLSDNEMYNRVDVNNRRKKLRKRTKIKSKSSTARPVGDRIERGYDSSGVIDSGFGPSPRMTDKNKFSSPRLSTYYEQRRKSASNHVNKVESKIPIRKPGDRYAVDMKSVTQKIQTNMRRYYCERKIFSYLLELKRLQIRSSKSTEAVLVKRAIDEYNKTSLVNIGMGSYNSTDYSFSSFEKFLYESLRKIQESGNKHLNDLPGKPPNFDYGEADLYKMSSIPDNPCLCTSKTHRCFHAVHAYTGVPCSAYIPQMFNHHTIPKPKSGVTKSTSSFLPKIDHKAKPHLLLEVKHGADKHLIELPSERLEKNKRYYVTFTVKSSNHNSDNEKK